MKNVFQAMLVFQTFLCHIFFMKRIFTAIYEKIDKWYVAYVEELPGVNTQGKTLSEARRNLKEALELILETNQILAKSQMQSRHLIRETVKISSR